MTTAAPPPHARITRSSPFPPIPGPLQRLFDLVPLVTYPANALPDDVDVDVDGTADAADADLPTLYVFISPADAARGRPSFNPTCLKWQTYLRFAGQPVRLAPSTNHASPSGALPFLLPSRLQRQQQRRSTPAPPSTPSGKVVAAHELPAYVKQQQQQQQAQEAPLSAPADPAAPAYQALLDTRIRRAWLHAVYLHESSSSASSSRSSGPIAARLYAQPASSSGLVQASLARQLQTAAAAEVWPHHSGSSAAATSAAETAQIYADAQAALQALATLLDDNENDDGTRTNFFFGSAEPTLFDAAVFAYTHLLLEDEDIDTNTSSDGRRFRWPDRTLPDAVRALPSLVRHRAHILAQYWPEWTAEAQARRTVAAGAGSPANVADSFAWVKV